MSISQNFPEEGPTLNLNFAGSRTLDPRITFTRTSSATYMGRDGLVKIAPANSARFDHRYNSTTGEVESLGLLVEEQRTNLLLRSEEFDDNLWSSNSPTVTSNSQISPDGTQTADTIETQSINQSFSVTAETNYTISLYINTEYTTSNFIRIRFGYAATSASVWWEPSTLQFATINSGITNASIIRLGSGWSRIYVSFLVPVGITSLNINLSGVNANGSGTISGEIVIWGTQAEQGAFPTSYIPTTTSTVTRTADNVSMVGENFSSWYNQSEGTISTQFLIKDKYPANGIVYLNINQNVNDSLRLFYNDGISAYSVSNRVSGVQNAILNLGGFSSNQKEKISFSYKLNDFSSSRNGLSPITASSGTLSSNNRLDIGVIQGGNHLNGHIAQLTYYPRRLTNAQLVTLTR
jgi:hypothetical protein